MRVNRNIVYNVHICDPLALKFSCRSRNALRSPNRNTNCEKSAEDVETRAKRQQVNFELGLNHNIGIS